MSGTAYHKNLAPSDIHICYAFLYADENARQLADGFSSSDVGKLARVVDPDNLLYILVNHSPPTWQKVGGVFDSATNINLGGVRVQGSGGLFIDGVGNISIKTEFLNKLQNLPNNIIDDLRSVIDPTGSSMIGFGGYNTTNLTVPADTVDNVLERIITKVSQMASDITTLKTTQVPQASENTLGGIKVISGSTSGLNMDSPTGYLSLFPDFLTKLNNLNNVLDGKLSSSSLSTSSGSTLIGYSGEGSSSDSFYLPPSNLESAIDTIVRQVKINTDASRSGILPATNSTLGGIKVGSGLTITGDGTLSSTGGGTGGTSYTLPTASAFSLGGVKVNGNGMSINGDGTLVCTVSGGTGGTSYTLPVATSSSLGGVKVGSGIALANDGTISVAGGSSGGGTTTTSSLKIYKIDIPDFTQATSTWVVTPNDGGISNIVKTGEDSFQVTYSPTNPPHSWSAINRSPSPQVEIIHSDVRFMRTNISAKTAEIVGVASSSNILVFLQFFDTGAGNVSSTGGVFTIEGTSGSAGTYTAPTGWTVSLQSPHLRIVHNKAAYPYGWNGLKNESGIWNEVMHDLAGQMLKVVDTNTLLITNIASISSAFKLYVMFS